MRFTKMHGIGNDYVYINTFEEGELDGAVLAPVLADRHRGVGGDGVILITPPAPDVQADVRMRMFNADGSESEMCGNGVRCVCKYAVDHGLSTANPMRVQTGAGVLSLAWRADGAGRVEQVTVDMGPAIVDLPAVPVDASHLEPGPQAPEHAVALPGGERFAASFVSMGNPHAVIFVDRVADVPLERLGPLLERHQAFPRQINVHFVQVDGPGEVTMRTWERGSGVTLACGTGASAVCVAGARTGRTERTVLAHLPGGDLRLHWRPDDHVEMTGSATEVFTGEWPEAELPAGARPVPGSPRS